MRMVFFLSIFLVVTCSANHNQQDFVPLLDQLKQQLQNLNVILKQAVIQSTQNIFQQLKLFSKNLDSFSKNPTAEILEQLINRMLYELLFEEAEQLSISELKGLQKIVADIFKKIGNIDQQIKRQHIDLYIQENFHERVFDFFKREKDVVDQFINQKILEFQKKLFEQTLKNVRNQLEKLQNEPIIFNLDSLANSFKFSIQSLNAIDRLDVLSQLFMNFNQLLKDVEKTFSKPIMFPVVGKKIEKEALIKKYRKQIFDSLYKTQAELRDYLKTRLAKSRKIRSLK